MALAIVFGRTSGTAWSKLETFPCRPPSGPAAGLLVPHTGTTRCRSPGNGPCIFLAELLCPLLAADLHRRPGGREGLVGRPLAALIALEGE